MKLKNKTAIYLLAGAMGGSTSGFTQSNSSFSIFYLDNLAVDRLRNDIRREETNDLFVLEPLMLADPDRSVSETAIELAPNIVTPDKPRDLLILQHLDKARSFAEVERWDDVLEAINSAVRLDPGNMAVLSQAALLFAQGGQFEKAEPFFRRYLTQNPDDAQFYAGWAAILFRLKRFEKAAETLDMGYKLDPDHLLIRFNRELLLVAQNLPPDDLAYWHNMSIDRLYMAVNWLHSDRLVLEPIVGKEAYRELVRRVLSGDCYGRLLEIATEMKALQDARKEQDWAAIRTSIFKIKGYEVGSMGLEFLLLPTLVGEGEVQSATRLAELMTRKYPENKDVWYNYGSILSSQDRHEEALVAFSESFLIDPDSPNNKFALAYSYAALDQMAKAWPLFVSMGRSAPHVFMGKMKGNGPIFDAIRNEPTYPSFIESLQTLIEAHRKQKK